MLMVRLNTYITAKRDRSHNELRKKEVISIYYTYLKNIVAEIKIVIYLRPLYFKELVIHRGQLSKRRSKLVKINCEGKSKN